MPDSFSPTTGSFITLSQAQTMVSAWATLQSSMSNSINEANPKSMAYGIDNVLAILNQEGCKGLRIYNLLQVDSTYLIVVEPDSKKNGYYNIKKVL